MRRSRSRGVSRVLVSLLALVVVVGLVTHFVKSSKAKAVEVPAPKVAAEAATPVVGTPSQTAAGVSHAGATTSPVVAGAPTTRSSGGAVAGAEPVFNTPLL